MTWYSFWKRKPDAELRCDNYACGNRLSDIVPMWVDSVSYRPDIGELYCNAWCTMYGRPNGETPVTAVEKRVQISMGNAQKLFRKDKLKQPHLQKTA